MDTQDYLKEIYLSLPELPGTYQFYNNEGKIIYVGKAKNLKRRVSSYFQKNILDKKTRFLVSKICDISYSVVNTEDDALLIEDSLIKQYQPMIRHIPVSVFLMSFFHVFLRLELLIRKKVSILVLMVILVRCIQF